MSIVSILKTVPYCCGLNNSVDFKAILGQYNELIDLAATAVADAGTVRVTSVCPRSNPETQARIDTLCQSRNIQFIDNDGNFKTRNGSSNYALIAKDGIHLNASDNAVLAKNLEINIQFKKDNSKTKQAVNNNATQVNRLPSFQPKQGKVRKPPKKQINDDKLKQPKKHVQNNKKYQQQVADQPNTLSEQPLRDFCGVTGHMSKACRFGSVVTCYLCGEKKLPQSQAQKHQGGTTKVKIVLIIDLLYYTLMREASNLCQ